jgi:hypothetical protein
MTADEELRLKDAALQRLAQLALQWHAAAEISRANGGPYALEDDDDDFAACDPLESCANAIDAVFGQLGLAMASAAANPPPPQTPPAAQP